MRQWYLRLGNDIVGPLPLSELRSLAREGGITPDVPVSFDRVTWHPARQIRELEFRRHNPTVDEEELDETAFLPIDSERSRSNLSTGIPPILWVLLGSISLGGMLILLVCGLLGILASGPPNTTVTTGTLSDPAAQRAHSTYQYWELVGSALRSTPFAGTADQQQQALRNTAFRIEQIPVVDVDPVAVQCALNVSRSLRYCAEVGGRNNDPSAFAEAIARGLAGDPFGKGLEMIQDGQRVRQVFENLQAEIAQTRAALSQKYGVEFPSW